MPLLEILLPTFNQSSLLDKTLQSLANSTFTNFHISLSDDASNDNTQEVVRKWINKLPMTSYKHLENLGGQGRGNLKFLFGLPTEAKYLFCIDGDDIVGQTQLQEEIDFLESSGAGAVHSDCDHIYEDGSMKTESWWAANGCFIENPMTVASQAMNNRLFTCTLIAKTELYKKAYSADKFTEMGLFLGDYACSSRLAYLTNVCYIDKPLAKYRWVAKSESHRDHNLLLDATAKVQEAIRTGELFKDLC